MRIEFGYRAEAKGHQPDDLHKYMALAQRAGFDFVPISDHFQLWFHTNATCPLAWSWISAAVADPRKLGKRGNEIPDEELKRIWTITTDTEDILRKAGRAIALGFDEIQFHSASPSEEEFLEACGREVLPHLKQV
jgi:hypothetical protein